MRRINTIEEALEFAQNLYDDQSTQLAEAHVRIADLEKRIESLEEELNEKE
jgi:predicted  nucleic acid-binding Zn-ribbon protein